MKNKYLCNFQKLLRAFLIFAMFATSSQIAAAQLNVALSNARLGTMIKQIKAQSKYQFFYDDNLASIPVHAVNLKNASLETVLDKALEGKGVSYRIEDGSCPGSPAGNSQGNGNRYGYYGRTVDWRKYSGSGDFQRCDYRY